MAKRKRISITLAFFLFTSLACGIAAFKRNHAWKNEITLNEDIVSKNPNTARPQNNLGLAYFESGMTEKAIGYYTKAIEINPYYELAYNNLGVSYYNLGRVDEAIAEFKTAISINPGMADAHYNLGIAYGDKGETALAYGEMQEGMRLSEFLRNSPANSPTRAK